MKYVMSIHEKVRSFGGHFKGRIDAPMLDAAMAYVDFNECRLAFETTCDHLCDGQVEVSQAEYAEILELGNALGVVWHPKQLSYLQGLVRQE